MWAQWLLLRRFMPFVCWFYAYLRRLLRGTCADSAGRLAAVDPGHGLRRRCSRVPAQP